MEKKKAYAKISYIYKKISSGNVVGNFFSESAMETLALTSLVLLYGLVLYLVIVSRINRFFQENQGAKYQEKLQRIFATYLNELGLEVNLLDGKIQSLRNLMLRTEKLLSELKEETGIASGVRLELMNLINQTRELVSQFPSSIDLRRNFTGNMTPETPENSFGEGTIREEKTDNARERTEDRALPRSDQKKTTEAVSKPLSFAGYYQANPDSMNDFLNQVQDRKKSRNQDSASRNETSTLSPQEENTEDSGLKKSILEITSGIGQAVKTILNIRPLSEEKDKIPIPQPPVYQKQTPRFHFVVQGNPLDEENTDEILQISPQSEDNQENNESFLDILQKRNEADTVKARKDKVALSLDSILAELPPNTPKIEKVEYLLRKGYSHDEISNLLDIGTREIRLIEIVRLEKTRRL